MKTNMLDKTPLTPGTCEWCGNNCELEDSCCSLRCEAQLARLEAAQGQAVLRVLKRWRKHRGRKGTPGEGAMTETAGMIDKFLKSDRIRRETENRKRKAKAKADAEEAAAVKAGDLDAGVPNNTDPGKRGFKP